MTVRILNGDVFDMLATLEDESVNCVVTSPPYWSLRDYGVDGQLGQEPTLAEHIETMVAVFEEVRRVLRKDGTVWLNYGDCYAANRGYQVADSKHTDVGNNSGSTVPDGLKAKDLCMVPNRLAIALQEAGWWVRSEIIWGKPNPMPESVTDRPATSHEKIFMLTKSARYWYDDEAVRTPASENSHGSPNVNPGKKQKALGQNQRGSLGQWPPKRDKQRGHGRRHDGFNDRWDKMTNAEQQAFGRNLRNYEPAPLDVWHIATMPFSEAHFATFPPALVVPCIKAGCPEHVCSNCGTVLDSLWQTEEADTNGNDLSELRGDIPQTSVKEEPNEVLFEEVRDECPEDSQADSKLRMVRETGTKGQEGQAQTLLQPGLRVNPHSKEPDHDEGLDDNQSRIQADQQTQPSERIKGRVRSGTSPRHGGEIGATINQGGSCTPHKRGQSRQPSREFASDGEEGTRPTTQTSVSRDLPELRDSVSGPRECPHCQSPIEGPNATISAGVVLDPFGGSGTVGMVADRLGRDAVLIELNPEYAEMAERRIRNDAGMFAEITS